MSLTGEGPLEGAPAWLHRDRDRLAGIGVGLAGVAALPTGPAAEAVRRIRPDTRRLVVVGSLGSALWEAAQHHHRSTGHPDPVDDLVRRALATPHDADRTWVFADRDEARILPLRTLAVAAGLGWSSRLGLVLHPEGGPWLGLRAVALTPHDLPVTGPRPEPTPCDGCPAPCAAACPVGALRPDLQLDRCLPQRAACTPGCHARAACPVGRDHAHAADRRRYHHDPAARADLQAAWRGEPVSPPAPRS